MFNRLHITAENSSESLRVMCYGLQREYKTWENDDSPFGGDKRHDILQERKMIIDELKRRGEELPTW